MIDAFTEKFKIFSPNHLKYEITDTLHEHWTFGSNNPMLPLNPNSEGLDRYSLV